MCKPPSAAGMWLTAKKARRFLAKFLGRNGPRQGSGPDSNGLSESLSNSGNLATQATQEVEEQFTPDPQAPQESSDLVAPRDADDKAQLPIELYDKAIEYLVNDRPSLIASSMTCRTWLHLARRHLYHSITLDTMPEYSRFQELLDISTTAGTGMAAYIRSVTIKMNFSTEVMNIYMPRVLLQLPRVEHLTLLRFLFGWNTRHIGDNARRAILSCAARITRLDILGMKVRSAEELMPLCMMSPHLRVLNISMVWMFKGPTPPLDTEHIDKQLDGRRDAEPLTGLSMYLTSQLVAQAVVYMVRHPASKAELRCIIWQDMEMTAEKSIELLQKLLRHSGPALEYLELTCRSHKGSCDEVIDLSDNTGLKILSLGSHGFTSDWHSGPFPLLPRVVSRITSPRFHILRLLCNVELVSSDRTSWGEVMEIDWRCVDETLVRLYETFPKLEIVFEVFNHHGRYSSMEVMGSIASRLPASSNAGRRLTLEWGNGESPRHENPFKSMT